MLGATNKLLLGLTGESRQQRWQHSLIVQGPTSASRLANSYVLPQIDRSRRSTPDRLAMALLCERRYECSEAVTVLAARDEVLAEIDDKGAEVGWPERCTIDGRTEVLTRSLGIGRDHDRRQ